MNGEVRCSESGIPVQYILEDTHENKDEFSLNMIYPKSTFCINKEGNVFLEEDSEEIDILNVPLLILIAAPTKDLSVRTKLEWRLIGNLRES